MGDHVALVVLAGGSGSRAGHPENKVYQSIAGRPMLSFSIEAAAASQVVDRLVVVIRDEDRSIAEDILTAHGNALPATFVVGGATRHESEWNALCQLADDIERGIVKVVAIHDGARPFLSTDLLRTLIEAAGQSGGALPGLPIEGVVTTADGSLVDTGSLRRVQTPQAFRAAPLLAAYRHAAEDGFEGVDTAETVARYTDGLMRLVPGDPRNEKVTYREDFESAEVTASRWIGGRWGGDPVRSDPR